MSHAIDAVLNLGSRSFFYSPADAAIACAVVFGVLTLALIAVALLRYNQRQQKVVPADQAIEHALSVYDNEFDEDEELFG